MGLIDGLDGQQRVTLEDQGRAAQVGGLIDRQQGCMGFTGKWIRPKAKAKEKGLNGHHSVFVMKPTSSPWALIVSLLLLGTNASTFSDVGFSLQLQGL